MTRRSIPQKQIDDRSFPVRMLLRVPEGGFMQIKSDLHQWLDQNVGRGEYAWHGGERGPVYDTTTLYFRHPRDAVAFLDAYPMIEVADGTMSPGYTSPYLSRGRR